MREHFIPDLGGVICVPAGLKVNMIPMNSPTTGCQTKGFLRCIKDTNKIISKTLIKITSRVGIAKVISAGVGHRVDTTTLIRLLFGPMTIMAIRGTSSFQIHGKK
jgi:hypothetical protein